MISLIKGHRGRYRLKTACSGISTGGGGGQGATPPLKLSLPLVWAPEFLQKYLLKSIVFSVAFQSLFDFARVGHFILLNAIFIAFI